MCVCVQETGGEGGELWQGRPTRAWARGSAGPQSLSELEAGECTAPNGDRHFGPLHGGRSAQPDMSKRSRRCLPGERPSKGGGGGAGRVSPGSGQMVKNHPASYLGKRGHRLRILSKVTQLLLGRAGLGAAGQESRGLCGNQASKERAPKHTGSQNYEVGFQRQREPSQPRGVTGGRRPAGAIAG